MLIEWCGKMSKKLVFVIAKVIEKIHIPVIKNTIVHKTSKVSSKSSVYDSSIDKYSYIGKNCIIINTRIGKFTSIANNVMIGGANHPIDWVSTSPVFHKGDNILRKNFSTHPFQVNSETKIGNDVWIGNNAIIKNGLTIGDGAIVGMGSVVVSSIGSYEIWAGNPAKLLRKRFSDDLISKLLVVKWWDLEETCLGEYAKYVNSCELFIEKVENGK